MTGTGEVDHELASEEEQELEKEREREWEREKEREDEGVVPPNYKPAHISEELAALGYYARSMKPRKGWLSESESLSIWDNPFIDILFQILPTALTTSSSIFPNLPVCL